MKLSTMRLCGLVAGVAALSTVLSVGAVYAGARDEDGTVMVASHDDEDTGSVVADGALPNGKISFLKEVITNGSARIPQLGWAADQAGPLAAGIRALPANSNSAGTALLAVDPFGGVCVTLILQDWQPMACGSADDVGAGRFFVSAQADSSTPRVLAAVVPDGATVRLNGKPAESTNNVWLSRITENDRVEIVGAQGDIVMAVLGGDLKSR